MDPTDSLCVNAIRCLVADIVEKSKSGHPGGAMGCAPMAHSLFGQVMQYSTQDPSWMNRDRFILSNGHISALQYAMLHLVGYDLSLADLQSFRQMGSRTPGHPENGVTPGVEVSTGPLGQGLANAVGMAIAEKHLAAVYNRPGLPLVDHHTFVICGDGCMQEGLSMEAASLAGHLQLGKLIVLYDDNHITIDGTTDLSFSDSVMKRFESQGWHTQYVEKGNTDVTGLVKAIEAAKSVTDKPSLIQVQTTIGFGSSKEGTSSCHGAPLGAECLKKTKETLHMDSEKSFFIPPDVYEYYHAAARRAEAKHAEWQALRTRYAAEFPEQLSTLERSMRGELPEGILSALRSMAISDKPCATRVSSGKVLNVIAPLCPEFMGGSADLSPSNNTILNGVAPFSAATPEGRYLHFGIREHAMSAICNGLWRHGGVRPFCATFLSFLQYMMGGVRLSAISHCPVLYVMTHDSIGVGEDGPTHQPIEHISQMRAMPNLLVFRPADEKETLGCYEQALQTTKTPSVLCLSRQNLPQLPGTSAEKVQLGAYTILETDPGQTPEIILIATGSEVTLAVEAAKLVSKKVRVVSMPCMSLFQAAEKAYRDSVFPKGILRVSIEAGTSFGWDRFSDRHIGCDTFGLSAPSNDVYKHFGLEPQLIAAKCLEFLQSEE